MMAISSSEAQAKFRRLMQRAVQITALLPDPENIDPDDPAVLAEVKMVLAEFDKVNSEIWEMLGVSPSELGG
jgi:hypothetical protein